MTDVQIFHDKGKLILADRQLPAEQQFAILFHDGASRVRKWEPEKYQYDWSTVRSGREADFPNPKILRQLPHGFRRHGARRINADGGDKAAKTEQFALIPVPENVEVFDTGGRSYDYLFVCPAMLISLNRKQQHPANNMVSVI